jgi:RsmE family RNA methyltransferase
MNLILLDPGELDRPPDHAPRHAGRPDGHVGDSVVRLPRAGVTRPRERDRITGSTPPDSRADHLIEVLHTAIGQTVRVGIIDGPLGTATVTAIADDAVTLRCRFAERPPERPSIDLLLALPRPKVLRRLWAQLAAIGVGRIILTNAERVERNYFDTHILSPEVYRPLLLEGLQQARDTLVPLVSIHRRFRVLVEDELDALSPETTRLVADPRGTLRIGEAPMPPDARRVLLAVGPEGGWNDFELERLGARGFQLASMGARTLRTDTACIALLGILYGLRTPRMSPSTV